MKDSIRDFLWKVKESLTKNKSVLISLGVLLLVIAVGGAVWLGASVFSGKLNDWDANKNTNDSISDNENTNEAAVNLVPRRIDGVLVPEAESNFYPTAIIIENLTAARPQSGLDKAQIVYEALAEGGITRFLAIYARGHTADVPQIGPVRSARPYYLDWTDELGAMFVHIGGSPQALTEINKRGIFDLNQFFNSKYFWRDKTIKTASEHTLFTSLDKLIYALRDKNKLDAQPTYDTWQFKSDKAQDSRPSDVKPITIDFSSFNYKVEYKYDREVNDYARFQAGQPHLMKSGDAIRAKNVLVVYTKTTLADKERLAMETVGEGEALIFIDGEAIKGKWKKLSAKDRLKFYDSEGAEVKLNAGTSWVEIVPTDRVVKYE